jgi:predicted nuclease of restriction endonuclease-like (RecB) superfamily
MCGMKKATRKSCRGKTSVEVVESVETGLPEKMRRYNAWIGGIARRYRQSQIKAATAVNVEMLKFYWFLGADIVRLEKDQPWGSKFMPRISADLKAWMPDAKCFSVRNLQYMRLFVELYGTREIAQQPVAQLERAEITQQPVAQTGIVAAQLADLGQFEQDFPNVSRLLFAVPWGHHIHIMDKFKGDQRTALFYVRKTVENGWSRAMLENNVASNLHLRQGAAETNFDIALTDPDSDLAKETLKDPYDFSFIAMDDKYREEELKTELIRNIEQFLQELGKGFSYLGREYKLQVGETQRAIDMLFYNVIERRYYVIEVKMRKFDPADVGQIGTYMVAVNRQLKQPSDLQTVGLIICREKDRVTAQYALESSALPIGVSDYVLERFIPPDFKSQMPSIEEVESELTRRLEIAEEVRKGKR